MTILNLYGSVISVCSLRGKGVDMQIPISQENYPIFNSLASPTRLHILNLLAEQYPFPRTGCGNYADDGSQTHSAIGGGRLGRQRDVAGQAGDAETLPPERHASGPYLYYAGGVGQLLLLFNAGRDVR